MGTSRRSTGRVSIDQTCVGRSVFPNNPLILIAAGPLPTLDGLADGLTDVVGKRNVSPLTRFPPLNHDDIHRFKRNFSSAGPIDGFLNGTRF